MLPKDIVLFLLLVFGDSVKVLMSLYIYWILLKRIILNYIGFFAFISFLGRILDKSGSFVGELNLIDALLKKCIRVSIII